MNKKGFLNPEVFMTPGFWALVILGWSAVIIGYKFSLGMDSGGFPLWQLIIILAVIFLASAFFARE